MSSFSPRCNNVWALLQRMEELGCYQKKDDMSNFKSFMIGILSLWRGDWDRFWFNLRWEGSFRSSGLLAHAMSEVKLPTNVALTWMDFGPSLLNTRSDGEPAGYAAQVLPSILEALMAFTTSTLLSPICHAGHSGMVIVTMEDKGTGGTIYFADALNMQPLRGILCPEKNCLWAMQSVLQHFYPDGHWKISTRHYLTNRNLLGYQTQNDSFSCGF